MAHHPPPLLRNRVSDAVMVVAESNRAMSLVHQISVMSWRHRRRFNWERFVKTCCGSLLQFGRDFEAELKDLKQESVIDAHKISASSLAARLGTDVRCGLNEFEVKERLYARGLNKIHEPPTKPAWLKFCRHMFDGFCVMLWIGSILCFVAYGLQRSQTDQVPGDNLYLGCVLAGVVFVTSAFSYIQEARSLSIMDSFNTFVPSYTTVVRSATRIRVPIEELVVGDLVVLKGGDKIPADCRVVACSSFRVDNSCLTGESEPQLRTTEFTSENPLETKNLIFYSTFAIEGNAIGVVIAVGDDTVMGRIARLTSVMKEKKTPLSHELQIFVYVICVFSVTLGLIFLIAILANDANNWIGAIVFAIGIIIGNVPEGVIIEFALCLTLAAKRMALRHALVKNLEAVETLGSTTVICSDKTGTLTQNKMTVAHVWFSDEVHAADTSSQQISALRYKHRTGWTALIRVAALCSRTYFKPNQDHLPVIERECVGDASETALLKFAELSIGSVEEFRLKWPKHAEIPFSSAKQFQASVHRRADGRFLLVVKGAPEKVFDMSATIWMGQNNGGEPDIDENLREHFKKTYSQIGALGERVLGFADFLLPETEFPPDYQFKADPHPNFPLERLRFVGLISMLDPPRPAAPEAIRKCREAGIRVAMVTGDHPVTARAVASMVGIFNHNSVIVGDEPTEILGNSHLNKDRGKCLTPNAIVVSGDELRAMSWQQLDLIVADYKEIVFARTSPQQKLQIVESFQRLGHIVAVTGDGVNDSPALKQADIGVAMGRVGSDVAKQAADMILMDDNFATITFAIEEGRLLYDNLKKTVCYILVANPPEIAAAIAYVAFSVPLPMNTIAMLTICLVTDMVPAVMLTYERAESDIMKRPPRSSKTDRLITRKMMSVAYGQNGIIEMAGAFLAYFVCLAENGFLTGKVFSPNFSARWDSQAVNDLEDSYGQEWTFAQRKRLENTLSSVYFLSMVVVQWVCVVCCKTLRESVIHHDWTNYRLFFGLLVETGVAVLLCYCPVINDAFAMAPIRGYWWLPVVPFAFLLLGVDQLRKFAIRRGGKGSFAEQELLL